MNEEEVFYEERMPVEPIGWEEFVVLGMSAWGVALLLIFTPFYYCLGLLFMFMLTGPWLVRLAKVI